MDQLCESLLAVLTANTDMSNIFWIGHYLSDKLSAGSFNRL